MENEIKCQICNRIFKTYNALSHHVVKIHTTKPETYYKTYINLDSSCGVCKVCGKQTNFRSI